MTELITGILLRLLAALIVILVAYEKYKDFQK